MANLAVEVPARHRAEDGRAGPPGRPVMVWSGRYYIYIYI